MPPTKGKMLDYSEELMNQAIDDVLRGTPVDTAAKRYSVPSITLMYKVKGITPKFRRMGPKSVLTNEEEDILAQWIITVAKVGFSVTKNELLDSVQYFIKDQNRKNSFVNNRPGSTWFNAFLKRHPNIASRMTQNLTFSRAAFCKEMLFNWFKEIQEFLEDNNYKYILEHPERIFNLSESALFLNPKDNKVLSLRSEQNTEENECLTVLITGNARGELAPPFVVFKYDEIPRELSESVPKHWGYGKSENSWMTASLFFEFITNIFHPFLIEKNIPLPVILFIDGYASNLTLHTSKFCEENGIILIALLSNSHINPIDVSVFHVLKKTWKEKLHQRELDQPVLKNIYFSSLLEETLAEYVTPSVLKNGFRECGIVPWNPEAVDFSKIPPMIDVPAASTNSSNKEELQTGLKVLEKYIKRDKLTSFRNSPNEWEGDEQDRSLFLVWKKMNADSRKNIIQDTANNETNQIAKIKEERCYTPTYIQERSDHNQSISAELGVQNDDQINSVNTLNCIIKKEDVEIEYDSIEEYNVDQADDMIETETHDVKDVLTRNTINMGDLSNRCSNMSDKDKDYSCYYCRKQFTQKKSLTEHLNLHFKYKNESNSKQSIQQQDELYKKSHDCDICGEVCLCSGHGQNETVEASPGTSKKSKLTSQWSNSHPNNWYMNNKTGTLNCALESSTDNSSYETKSKSDQKIVKSEPSPPKESAVDFKYSTTERGKQVLIYLGFEYLHFRITNGVSTWRCRLVRSLRCHSSMKTKNKDIICHPTAHCHDSCPQNIEANIAKRKMVQAMSAADANSRNVIGSILSKVNDEALAYLPKKSSLSRTLLKHKSQNHSPNPTNINFIIPEQYCDVVLYDTGVNDPERIIALGDKEIMLELKKDIVFGDGTFDQVPQMCFQLYTWHARIGNLYPPCIYFLLQNKTIATYDRMFYIMKQLIPDLAPESILLDFEKAAIHAAQNAFSQSEVKGCYFHLTQSLVRKINSVGLKSAFENDLEVKLKLKSLPALAFVPADDVKTVFSQLTHTFPEENSYNEIITYFYSTYIEGAAGKNPQFPISLWNHYSAAIEKSPKTTNCWEGFHNALNAIFSCSHPSIWYLFHGLHRDLVCHRLTVANLKSGREEKKNAKYETLQNVVSNIVSEYHQTNNKLLYLRRLANLQ